MDWQIINSFAPWLIALISYRAYRKSVREREEDKRRKPPYVFRELIHKWPHMAISNLAEQQILLRIANGDNSPLNIVDIAWTFEHSNQFWDAKLKGNVHISSLLPVKLGKSDISESDLNMSSLINCPYLSNASSLDRFFGIFSVQIYFKTSINDEYRLPLPVSLRYALVLSMLKESMLFPFFKLYAWYRA